MRMSLSCKLQPNRGHPAWPAWRYIFNSSCGQANRSQALEFDRLCLELSDHVETFPITAPRPVPASKHNEEFLKFFDYDKPAWLPRTKITSVADACEHPRIIAHSHSRTAVLAHLEIAPKAQQGRSSERHC